MQPNLLIIFPDQLRRAALGIYGDPNVSTPHIDRLAREGVRFSNACSTYPICVPFRFTLMTGEYAHSRFIPGIEWRMSPAERTLADEFNEAGYHTAYVGKWHLYGGAGHLPGHHSAKAGLTPVPRLHRGRWEKWLGFELFNDPFRTCYFEDDDPTPHPLRCYQTDGLFDLAMKHLREGRPKDRPFCCVVSVEPPHFPLRAPPQYEARWRDRPVKLPANFLHRDARPAPGKPPADREKAIADLRLYYAMIENLDDNVGKLMAFLDQEGLRDNTIVVLISDHGQCDGAHNVRSITKDHPFEESIGIPLIIRDPRCSQVSQGAGAVVDVPTCTEDLFPTLLGLAGLTPRDRKPGMDLTALIHGRERELPRPGVLLEFVHDLRINPDWGLYHATYWRGFRTARYKYTVLGGAEGGEPWQFFDLANDPLEMTNLLDDPAWRSEVAAHHRLLRHRLVETVDHYVLKPAFGEAGLNEWKVPAEQR